MKTCDNCKLPFDSETKTDTLCNDCGQAMQEAWEITDNLTQQSLQQFFEDRPALSKRMVAIESGISARTLDYALSEARISEQTEIALLPILSKYGWEYGRRIKNKDA